MDDQRRIAPPGEIVVLWPFRYDEVAWNISWRKMLPLLKEHGFNWRALTSSSDASFSGTRESADFLQSKIAEIDSAFTVRWYPPTDLLPAAEPDLGPDIVPAPAVSMQGMKARFPIRWLFYAAIIVAAVLTAAPFVPVPYVESPWLLLLGGVSLALLAAWLWSLARRR